jgi:hypothetical protein
VGRIGIDDLEELQTLRLDLSEQEELLEAQTECTFVFANDQGWPSGVIMSFVRADGAFWLTAVENRVHVKALAAEPRVTTVHRDRETLEWFLPKFTSRMQPTDPVAFARLLDSPRRVVFEVRPVAIAVSHDSRKMPGNGRGGPAE